VAQGNEIIVKFTKAHKYAENSENYVLS